jgi:hypothetical protein
LWILFLYISVFGISTFTYTNFYNTLSTPPAIRKIIYAFFTLFEFSAFSFFIYLNISNRGFKRLMSIFAALFFIFVAIYYFFAQLNQVDSIPIGIESILILIFSSYFLYEQVNDPKNFFIYNDYRFWVVLGFMIYLSGSFFIYLLANQLSRKELEQYWMFTDIFYTLKNVFFSIGILVYSLRPTQKHHAKPQPNHHYLDIT